MDFCADLTCYLFFLNKCSYWQKADAIYTFKRGLNMIRIRYILTKHLITSTNSNNRPATSVMSENLLGMATIMQIIQVIYGVFAPGNDNNICISYFFTIIHIPDVNIRFPFKGVEVCKIGNMRKTNNGNINLSISP